jgi:YVTN family beta-propeller protein
MNRLNLMFALIAPVLLAGLGMSTPPPGQPQAHAPGSTTRVYVTNSKGDDVTVIDPATMKVVGSIKTGANPHGVVASPDRRTLYISVEGTDELIAVDVATNQVKWRVKVGRAPNEVSITRDGRKVFVPLRNDNAIDVVDTATMKVIDRLKAPAWPHNTYVSENGRHLYLGTMAGSRITIYDTATHKQISEIAPGDWVRPIALFRDEKLAYVALSKLHGFAVVDLKEGKTIRRVELPALPAGTEIPPYDTLTHGLALTPDERELYVTSMAGKAIYAFSVPELKQLAKIDVGRYLNWTTINPDGRLVWVSNQLDDTVSAVDPRTKQVVATIPVGHEPKRLLAVEINVSSNWKTILWRELPVSPLLTLLSRLALWLTGRGVPNRTRCSPAAAIGVRRSRLRRTARALFQPEPSQAGRLRSLSSPSLPHGMPRPGTR